MHKEPPSPSLFPSFVTVYGLSFDVADGSEGSQELQGIPLPTSLRGAVRKRQVEFLAGRYCAREALRRGAPELADRPIERGANGEPLWPPGVVGAITHIAGYACVAIARADHAGSIGIDAERWMTDELARSIAGQITRPGEVDALSEATALSFSQAVTVIFSAKETVFKCLFPIVRRYFDFRDVVIASRPPGGGLLAAHLLIDLHPSLIAGYALPAHFECIGDVVITGMLVAPTVS